MVLISYLLINTDDFREVGYMIVSYQMDIRQVTPTR